MPQHTYVDFDLLIEPGDDGGYEARVVTSPVGETPPVPVTIPFSELEVENFLLRVGRPRRQPTRGEGSPEALAVREFGGRLFEAVFRDRVRAALARSLDQVDSQDGTGLRVRLRLADAPELADLPWEYLYNTDTRRFVALGQWTPLVRYLELARRIRPLTVQPPLRILMMAAGPTDFPPLDAATEWQKVREALDDLVAAGRVQVDRVPTGRLADLRAALRTGDHHVFHFIGHGRYDPDAKDGVLALEGPGGRAQLLNGADLGALLSDHRSLRLALLNSCEGARGGRADPYSGTAQSLIYQGIPAVVAMQFEITDTAAITFAHSLYAAVADGYPLDAAVAEARNAVKDEPNAVEWATPVLYLRAPDGRIFDVPNPVPRPDLPPGPPPPVQPPAPPPTTPPGPPPPNPRTRRRGRLVAAALAAAAVLGGGAWWIVGQPSDPPDGSSSPSASSPPVSSSSPASSSPPDLGLPQGPPLPESTLVAPLRNDEGVDLYLLDTAGGDAVPLVTADSDEIVPLISTDRTSIVYARSTEGGYELRTVASDGSGDRLLFDPTVAGCSSFTRPGWNRADPRLLALPCTVDERVQVKLTTLDGVVQTTLDPGVPHIDDITISPDGTQVVYWGAETNRSDSGRLFSLPTNASGPAVPLTEHAGDADPVWSADGEAIAFRRRTPDGSGRIYVMSADGSDERELTRGPWIEQDPTWSPDGQWLAFKSDREGELPGDQIWVMDRDGNGLRQLGHAVGGTAEAPAWSHR